MRISMRVVVLVACLGMFTLPVSAEYEVTSLSSENAEAFELDPEFYTKSTEVEGILITTSDRVSDLAIKESAYLFEKIMNSINQDVAARIRERKVLCLLIGHDELTSDLPQFRTDLTGKELDFYNWRRRGFLTWQQSRPIVVFAEEDVLEYEGGMQKESILIHEFGHVIMGVGFTKEQKDRVTELYVNAIKSGLWNDGVASQRFRRVNSAEPVLLIDALCESFPDQPRKLFENAMNEGDILVNGRPTNSKVEVTKDDEVLIIFGGPKQTYAGKNRSEYWAELVQNWYDTNRVMDHDHNHIHTRRQLKEYDPQAAAFCEEILGDSDWRFVSPRERAGQGHLEDFNHEASPVMKSPEHIKEAGNDFFDRYWKDYWQRLRKKHLGVEGNAG